MKKIYRLIRKNSFVILILLLALAANTFSQTPMYYNNNTGNSNNAFPFNMGAGKGINALILAGEFINPSPLPSGQQITKVYWRSATTGTRTYTNLHILLKQDTITNFEIGHFYSFPMDTVYFKTTTSLTTTAGQWFSFDLDTAYPYDPSKSLIIFAAQCGISGSGTGIYNSTKSGIRRIWSIGGCPLESYNSGDGQMCDFGVDVSPMTGIKQVQNNLPAFYTLEQNYPNPFNPSTIISFSLPKAGDVQLSVFDAIGRKVATLADGYQTAGQHNIEFNASSLASGVYFYTLTAGDFTATKKMLLVK